jgi:nucleoside-diphosphate-sugar epimerase
MTTLVTGVSGRLGSRFVPRLLAEGEHTRVLVRDAEAGEQLRERGTEVVEGDLRDPAAVRRAVDGVDSVVHLAAAFRGVAEEEVVAVNQAAVHVAPAATAAGVSRFVFASTNLVYGHYGRLASENASLRLLYVCRPGTYPG